MALLGHSLDPSFVSTGSEDATVGPCIAPDLIARREVLAVAKIIISSALWPGPTTCWAWPALASEAGDKADIESPHTPTAPPTILKLTKGVVEQRVPGAGRLVVSPTSGVANGKKEPVNAPKGGP